MALLRKLALGLAAALVAASAAAAPQTPPNFPTAPTINNPDLLLVWPCTPSCPLGGPLENVPFSTVKTLVTAGLTGTFAQVANNLSDLTSVSAARANLGLGSAALQSTSAFLQPSNNLSDVSSVSTARTHLGLGTAATQNTTAFLQPSNNLSDVSSASSARTNLGLGGAAVLNVGTSAGQVAAGNDSRFSGPTQNSQSASYGFVASDAGAQIYHPSADTTPRTWTIPANASVPYAVGTKLELVNDCSAGAITLAITSDTLEWFPSGGTGTRTLAACSISQITKVTSTVWVLTGVGVS